MKSCRMQILGPDPNNPKKPARMPSDPNKKAAIKGKIKACQVKRNQKLKDEGKKVIKDIGNKLGLNKKNK
tara:strand:+ start:519 stop:728 length:210 start_codon:yes stop_codon:yes gene_type:complete